MKKIIYLIAGISLFSSCSDLLDELPDSQVPVNSPERIKRVLVNAYPGASAMMLNEYSSDNIADNGTIVTDFNYLTDEVVYWKTINEYGNYEGLEYVWAQNYKAISHANEALEGIAKLGNDPKLNPAKAEALLARAYAHFELVNTFCKAYNPTTSSADLGIPYALTSETKLDPKYGRSTVAQVYQHIAADLQEGLPLIEDSYYQMPKYHFNKKAANAFAARFYLYYQNWDKAIEYANNVLSTNDVTTKSLLRNWEDFRDVNKAGSTNQGSRALYYAREDIEANLLLLPISSQLPTAYYTQGVAKRYTHNVFISETQTIEAKNVWDPQGKSGKNNYGYEFYWFMPIKVDNGRNSTVFFDKFPSFSTGSTSRTVIVPFTTDETLLVRAEAKIHKGEYEAALKDLNLWTSKFIQQKTILSYSSRNEVTLDQVKSFYNAMAYSQNTQDGLTQKKQLTPSFAIANDGTAEPLLHYLLQCRRILTLGEGLRWQDVKRYNIEVSRFQTDNVDRHLNEFKASLPASDERRAIQLPASSIKAGIQPNPR
nr:RagB/SusD family nutrient uptake outer membrane protein [uncultured Capnocytophaga sp.]